MRYREIREYKTKDNKEITFKITRDIEGNENRGWIVHEIKPFVDGKSAGYIKISYIPRERFEEFYPTIFNFISQISGSLLLPIDDRHLHWQTLDTENLRKFVQNVYWLILHEDYSTDEIFKSLPREDLIKMVEDSMDAVNKKYGQKFKEFEAYHVDKPIVDYIRVEEEFQRKHIALSLYWTAAKWLKKQGLKLHASSLQSPEAELAWKKLKDNNFVKIDKKRKYISI